MIWRLPLAKPGTHADRSVCLPMPVIMSLLGGVLAGTITDSRGMVSESVGWAQSELKCLISLAGWDRCDDTVLSWLQADAKHMEASWPGCRST